MNNSASFSIGREKCYIHKRFNKVCRCVLMTIVRGRHRIIKAPVSILIRYTDNLSDSKIGDDVKGCMCTYGLNAFIANSDVYYIGI